MDKLIHIARIKEQGIGSVYLFLRQVDPHSYTWFKEEKPGKEIKTSISGPTVEEAIRLARQAWKTDFFRTLHCGFRYHLPARDEHGQNALFHQMIASYSSMNGIYFDNEIGHNCIVSFASIEAFTLWKRLNKRLNFNKSVGFILIFIKK